MRFDQPHDVQQVFLALVGAAVMTMTPMPAVGWEGWDGGGGGGGWEGGVESLN